MTKPSFLATKITINKHTTQNFQTKLYKKNQNKKSKNPEIERYLHFTDTHKGSRRGSRNSSSASATSMRSNRSLQHHKADHHTAQNGTHTVVTDPNQLFSVNQQQHIQHQLMMHQQQQNGQRRRSSIHQSVVQHVPAPVQHHANIQNLHQHPPQQPAASSHDTRRKSQDVKVEITEVKP